MHDYNKYPRTCKYCMSWMLDHPTLDGWKRCENCRYSFNFKEPTMPYVNNFSHTDQMVTAHFSVKDMCFLHQWGRLATTAEGMDIVKLTTLANKMEEVRTILGNIPMNSHCGYRSPAYNKLIGANEDDPHSRSEAMDFDCLPALSCDEVKLILEPHLESLGIRMEKNGDGATWVHLDLCPVIHNRYFLP